MDYFPFHGACWDALSNAAVCPDLQVLWVDCPIGKDGRIQVTGGNHDTTRRVVQTRAATATLRLAMINPDTKLQSSLILSSDDSCSKRIMTARMAGKKEPKKSAFPYDFGY
jgi:hypothetical protein